MRRNGILEKVIDIDYSIKEMAIKNFAKKN